MEEWSGGVGTGGSKREGERQGRVADRKVLVRAG